jgi:tripartite-type tricarboxylate transporter receptor subunit TctC
MKLPRRTILRLAAGAVALPAASRITRAQSYPSRPLHFIVGFPSGGAADITARVVGQWMSEQLGQSVIIENKPGAATNVALQAVLAAPADGYTFGYISSSATINASLYAKLPFNIARDFAPVAGMVNYPHVLVVNTTVPAQTIVEFIAYLKANPGMISMASYGTGTTSHLAGELFMSMTGTRLVHVPYRGDAQAFPDLISDRVQMYITPVTGALPHIKSGALRPLAMMGNSRSEVLPDVPVLAEFVPGYEVNSFAGVTVKAGTPPDIIERLNGVINAGLADPQLAARLGELGAIPLPFTPAEFGAYMAKEAANWAKVVRAADIRIE